MSNIPTQEQNPNGLHARYHIQKIDGWKEVKNSHSFVPRYEAILKPVDKNAEYFIMRLDDGGKDPKHIEACRIGVNAYADAIEQHLPELAKDLRERYPLPASSLKPKEVEQPVASVVSDTEIESMAIAYSKDFGFADLEKVKQAYIDASKAMLNLNGQSPVVSGGYSAEEICNKISDIVMDNAEYDPLEDVVTFNFDKIKADKEQFLASLPAAGSAAVVQGDAIGLFREFAMRAQYFFPETEKDLDWFNGNIEDKREMLARVSEYLGLGKLNEDEIIK